MLKVVKLAFSFFVCSSGAERRRIYAERTEWREWRRSSVVMQFEIEKNNASLVQSFKATFGKMFVRSLCKT